MSDTEEVPRTEERRSQPAPAASPDPYGPVKRLARRAAKGLLILVAGYLGLVLMLILLYRIVNPPASTLMAWQWLTGVAISHEWKDIDDISPELVRAVIIAEDWSFCRHAGIDFEAIEQAIEKAGDGLPRGASTISMQVVKNLFLNHSRSYIRKAIELPLTLAAELIWPKRRMLEIYLNIAEWGPGVFGAEAAARHHFGTSARDLSGREAALLASVLPSPLLRDAGNPGRLTSKKASVIQARVRAASSAANCVLPPARRPAATAKPDSNDGWQPIVRDRAE
ncbi:MAG: monofunctional biosynthetic peptidoglycan transglycosylase [Hyphomicrobium sp.]|nr:monofunctional biosynthetic peptidoglycan transglycosylase [Hyphomicrobium sp.]